MAMIVDTLPGPARGQIKQNPEFLIFLFAPDQGLELEVKRGFFLKSCKRLLFKFFIVEVLLLFQGAILAEKYPNL